MTTIPKAEGAPLAVPTDPSEGDLVPVFMAWVLAAAWVGIYVAMTVVQGGFRREMGPTGPGVIDVQVAHEFGALTARDFTAGQVWRAITATFVHYSLLHLACNLVYLISLGRSLESWYGGPQFLAVYLFIGGLGNALAVAGRYALGGNLNSPTGGGSSVLFGLIALVAVVGWRSKTRFGDYVRRQMLGKLILFGVVIGVLARNLHVDNYGHAGGAIAGALVGFSHRYLIAVWDRRAAKLAAGAIATIVLGATIVLQARAGRREDLARRAQVAAERAATKQAREQQWKAAHVVLLDGVQRIQIAYAQMANLIERSRGPFRADPTVPLRREIRKGLAEVASVSAIVAPDADPEAFRRWRELAEQAARRQPKSAEMREFLALSGPLVRRVQGQARAVIPDLLRPVLPGISTAR